MQLPSQLDAKLCWTDVDIRFLYLVFARLFGDYPPLPLTIWRFSLRRLPARSRYRPRYIGLHIGAGWNIKERERDDDKRYAKWLLCLTFKLRRGSWISDCASSLRTALWPPLFVFSFLRSRRGLSYRKDRGDDNDRSSCCEGGDSEQMFKVLPVFGSRIRRIKWSPYTLYC